MVRVVSCFHHGSVIAKEMICTMKRSKRQLKRSARESQKRDAFDLHFNGSWTVDQLATRFKTTKRTIYRWISEKKRETPVDAPPPKRKRQRPRKYPDAIFERIKALKVENPRRMATNIHYKLKDEFPESCPSIHLVRKYMAKEELNAKDPASRMGYKKFSRKQPNDLWQIDIAGVQHLPGLGDVYLIAILDDCSRYCMAGMYIADQRGVNVMRILRNGIEDYGRPNQLLSDNGKQFKNLIGDLGTRYTNLLETLDVKPIFARKRHPQTKGKLEKFFEFVISSFIVEEYTWFSQHPGATLDDLNEHFQKWLHWYNHERPHRALPNHCPPANMYFDDSNRIVRPLETLFDWDRWLVTRSIRVVTKYNAIAYKKETIQLPPGYMKCRVDVVEGEHAIEVYHKELRIATHEINRNFSRIRDKQFLRKVTSSGLVKYKGEWYRVDPMLAGKQATIRIIDEGQKIAIYIDNTFFEEYPIKSSKKKKINDE
jgi:transposase InsO family protein